MILWTIMPLELVFDQKEISNSVYEEIEYAGTKMEVMKLSDNQCRIVRILSTEPQDYLRDEIQPGTVLINRPAYQILAH